MGFGLGAQAQEQRWVWTMLHFILTLSSGFHKFIDITIKKYLLHETYPEFWPGSWTSLTFIRDGSLCIAAPAPASTSLRETRQERSRLKVGV